MFREPCRCLKSRRTEVSAQCQAAHECLGEEEKECDVLDYTSPLKLSETPFAGLMNPIGTLSVWFPPRVYPTDVVCLL